jgi:hypothetical protein
MSDTVTFTAPCPACGRDTQWAATKDGATVTVPGYQTGSTATSPIPTYAITCECTEQENVA